MGVVISSKAAPIVQSNLPDGWPFGWSVPGPPWPPGWDEVRYWPNSVEIGGSIPSLGVNKQLAFIANISGNKLFTGWGIGDSTPDVNASGTLFSLYDLSLNTLTDSFGDPGGFDAPAADIFFYPKMSHYYDSSDDFHYIFDWQSYNYPGNNCRFIKIKSDGTSASQQPLTLNFSDVVTDIDTPGNISYQNTHQSSYAYNLHDGYWYFLVTITPLTNQEVYLVKCQPDLSNWTRIAKIADDEDSSLPDYDDLLHDHTPSDGQGRTILMVNASTNGYIYISRMNRDYIYRFNASTGSYVDSWDYTVSGVFSDVSNWQNLKYDHNYQYFYHSSQISNKIYRFQYNSTTYQEVELPQSSSDYFVRNKSITSDGLTVVVLLQHRTLNTYHIQTFSTNKFS